ncbi:hypothetical protein TorRG33x02_013330 [Trema orientale]|uniref:Uncharacterized protein n=1 Tax=Trema orientale TaxID=63057 RepID=A0A2P5FZR1_TREOI|nr:hypothetical protein TorRG33x02_013330 [Trema orientale]
MEECKTRECYLVFIDNECVAPLDTRSSLVYSLPQAKTQEPKLTKAYLSHRQPLAAHRRDYHPFRGSDLAPESSYTVLKPKS